eukprot:TRINITY_DN3364_c0_g1_i1.p1 TRINITY_DN3364_c0_g1~~TRINITY_DN3364_c0_g1_i1.p1  ORF type:complete len:176 (+),score=26.65 TRINITY_DN3364_c0_g1_i1:152-679(+)
MKMQAAGGLFRAINGVRHFSSASNSSSTASAILTSLKLRSGDALVQNEADSELGKEIIRLAKKNGITTISIIANTRASPQVIESLKEIGGDVVVTEDYAKSWHMKRLASEIKPIAGINFATDYQATAVGKAVAEGGTLLTYGKKLPSQVAYDGATRKPIEWGEFLKKKKLNSQAM